jgi:hypothetical protein
MDGGADIAEIGETRPWRHNFMQLSMQVEKFRYPFRFMGIPLETYFRLAKDHQLFPCCLAPACRNGIASLIDRYDLLQRPADLLGQFPHSLSDCRTRGNQTLRSMAVDAAIQSVNIPYQLFTAGKHLLDRRHFLFFQRLLKKQGGFKEFTVCL